MNISKKNFILKMIIVTFKYDFGTILSLETIKEFFGKDIRNYYSKY